MIDKYYTVEQISEMLNMHPKTIQRYIREGKLSAKKIGKSWRVTGHNLSIFAESEKKVCLSDNQKKNMFYSDHERAKVSAVVDINVYGKEEATHIIDMLTAALNSKPPEYGNSTMYTQYILEEDKVRVTLWGGIRFMEVMMSSIATLAEQIEE